MINTPNYSKSNHPKFPNIVKSQSTNPRLRPQSQMLSPSKRLSHSPPQTELKLLTSSHPDSSQTPKDSVGMTNTKKNPKQSEQKQILGNHPILEDPSLHFKTKSNQVLDHKTRNTQVLEPEPLFYSENRPSTKNKPMTRRSQNYEDQMLTKFIRKMVQADTSSADSPKQNHRNRVNNHHDGCTNPMTKLEILEMLVNQEKNDLSDEQFRKMVKHFFAMTLQS